MNTRYVVTGVNRLTGCRERISVAYSSKGRAEEHRKILFAIKPSKRAYLRPKVEPLEQVLFK